MSATRQIYLSAQRESDALKDWAAQVVGEAEPRLGEKRKLEYLRWSNQMEILRDAFERCAAQLTSASAGAIEMQIQKYPIIDQAAWENLRSGFDDQKAWFFRATCRRERHVLQYCFFFGKHRWSEPDRQLQHVEPTVCLLIGEQSRGGNAIRPDELENAKPTMRELLFVNGRLVQKHWDASQTTDVYDQDCTAVDVAQQFFQEVLLGKLAS